MPRSFTTEELADRWYDRREIMNLAGKYVTALLLKQEGSLFDRFWTKNPDSSLSFNDGSYLGPAAIRDYYAFRAESAALQSRLLGQMFPDRLGALTEEERFGAGQLQALPITTPVIEIAGDGETAKGLWHIQGAENGLTPAGPLSFWALGFLAIDFLKQEENWKLWHVFHAEDIHAPMGEHWLRPERREPIPGFEALTALSAPAYSITRQNHIAYNPERPFTPPPMPPEAYEHFAETFSYGPQEVRS